MKKNFFKKLSFVMALAMIVSVIAPAAGAFAATAPKLNASTKYLTIAGTTAPSEFDFNVVNKDSAWKYKYTSSKPEVATVTAGTGVVKAVAVGTTTITCAVTNKETGKLVKNVTATVKVKDAMTSITLTGKPDKDTVAVGVENDFGRTFVTEANKTAATSTLTRYAVNATSDKAVIDPITGKFTATVAGKYTVKVMGFQTVAKYNAWVAAGDFASDTNVVAKDSYDVTVPVGIAKVELVKPNQVKVTFNSSVKDVVKAAADIAVNLKLNDNYTALVPVKSFDKISDNGLEVTFTTYDNLVNKQTYNVAAAGATAELYAQIGTPVSISMENQTFLAGTATTIAYTLKDQYGVDVSSLYNSSVTKVSTIGWDNSVQGVLKLTNGQVAFVEYSYLVIKADGTTETIKTGLKSITGVAATVGSAVEWNIDDNTGDHFATADKNIQMNETGKFIWGRVKNSAGTYVTTYTFESMETSKLIIDKVSGALTAVTGGTSALVKVMDASGATVAYITVDVLAASSTQSIKAVNNTVNISSTITVNGVATADSATVDIKNVDQFNNETGATVTLSDCYVASATRTQDIVVISKDDADTIRFTSVPGKTGSFVYVVKVGDKTTTVTVNVVAPGTLTNYSITADKTAIDAFKPAPDNTINFTVYGVDAAGYKTQKVVASGASATVTYTVVGPNSFSETLTDPNADGTVTFDLTDTVDTTAKAGTYTLKVNIGGVEYTQSFTVNNTRSLPVVTVKANTISVASGSAVSDAVASLLGFKVGDDDTLVINDIKFTTSNSNLVDANAANFDAAVTGTVQIYIYSVDVTTDAAYLYDNVAVGKSFTINVTN